MPLCFSLFSQASRVSARQILHLRAKNAVHPIYQIHGKRARTSARVFVCASVHKGNPIL